MPKPSRAVCPPLPTGRLRKKARHTARIWSWNVNGLRAQYKKGFAAVLKSSAADIFAVQETRADEAALTPEQKHPRPFRGTFVAAAKKGYAGVGTFARRPADEVYRGLGEARFDDEGRFLLTRHGRVWVANGYYPNGSGKNRDHSRVPYKIDFYAAVAKRLEPLVRDGERVFVMGDLNTAPTALDLARPKTNHKTSGFLTVEREAFAAFMDIGLVDSFRRRCGEGGHYSWWSQRFGVRERNIGWRIDFILASASADDLITEAYLMPEVYGSDHCPVGVDVRADAF